MAKRYRRAALPTGDSSSENDDDGHTLPQSPTKELPSGREPRGWNSKELPSGREPREWISKEFPSGTEPRGWISAAEWRINIKQTDYLDSQRAPSVVSIFRVPNFLKDSKREAYVPKIVSLGPYHHRTAELPPMDNHKGRALRRMMTRFNINRKAENVLDNMEFYISANDEILQLDDEIRNSYEEIIDCKPEDFALMLCLDGCFILEFLRTLGGGKFPIAEARNYYEPVFEKNKIDFTGFHILNDILMLENQIPLIVLQKLLELELGSVDKAQKKLFKVLVKAPRSKFYPFAYDVSRGSWPEPHEQVHDLLGLWHRFIVYGTKPADQIDTNGLVNSERRRIPRAIELRNAGIEFEPFKFEPDDEVGGIKEIKFKPNSAAICLPQINITDHTEVLFRNLIALEVCKPSRINYVTCYLSLMDELIHTEEDVAVLRRSGIVKNYLGSETEVADLFNGLCKGVTLSRIDVFDPLKQQVNNRYTKKCKVWFTELVKEHFSSPWRSLALLGAFIGLLLTGVQTVFSIISVYK